MCHKQKANKHNTTIKEEKTLQPEEEKQDTGFKNHIIEYDEDYLDNSMAHE